MEFRGKSENNNKWMYSKSIYYQPETLGEIPYLFDDNLRDKVKNFGDCWIAVFPETVGVFTGLKDKNGVEIYEGDILEYEHREVSDSNVVTFKNGSFMLTKADGSRFYPYNAVVIGNIYENTELLIDNTLLDHMKTTFVKETDKKGRTYIIEGNPDGNFFNIKRFICEVQEQDTKKETQELADMLLAKLNNQ